MPRDLAPWPVADLYHVGLFHPLVHGGLSRRFRGVARLRICPRSTRSRSNPRFPPGNACGVLARPARDSVAAGV